MKKLFKASISLLLCVCLCISSTAAFASEKSSADFDPYKVKLYSEDLPRIKGNFIQPWLFAHWDEERWKKELSMWKQIGIEYVIMGDTANKTSNGWQVFYQSQLPFLQGVYTDPVVDNLMKYCDMYDIKVILGIGLNTNWYDYDLTTDEGTAEMAKWRDTSAQIMQELYDMYKSQYPDTFYGWYWVEELYNDVLWYNDDTRAVMAKNMASLFNIVIDKIEHTAYPDMPLFFSPHVNPNETGPFSGYSCTDLTKVTDFWAQFIRQTNFRPQDVLIPQSSVDHAACTIDKLDDWTKFYADAIAASGKSIRFWSNVESFHGNDTNVVDINLPNHAYSRPLDVFTQQLKIVSKYCDTIFSFAYSHFYSPYVAIGGYHESYLYYLENGKVETNKPIGPNKIKTSVTGTGSNRHLKLTWSGVWDDLGVGRINIYKNGKLIDYLINNIGNDASRTAPNTWEDKDFNPDFSAAIYEIQPIDVSGNAGKRVSIAVCNQNAANAQQLDSNFIYTYNAANPLASLGAQAPAYCQTPITGNTLFTYEDDIFTKILVDQISGDSTLVSKLAVQLAKKENRDLWIRNYTDSGKQQLAYSWYIPAENIKTAHTRSDFSASFSFNKENPSLSNSNVLNLGINADEKFAFSITGDIAPLNIATLRIPIGTSISTTYASLYYDSGDGKIASVGKRFPVENGYIELKNMKLGNYLLADENAVLSSYKLGDINQDGDITIKDALLALQYSVKLTNLNQVQVKCADVNADSEVTIKDALQILRYSVKLIDNF